MALGLALALAPPGVAAAPPLPPLAAKVGAADTPLIRPELLTRIASKLQRARAGEGVVRVLHLGDSHVAADLITKTIRRELQSQFGDAGRGFTGVEQSVKLGGRSLRDAPGWRRDRIVDAGRAGVAFGFAGISLESTKKGAALEYRLEPADRAVELHYEAGPGRGPVQLLVGEAELITLDTASPKAVSRTHRVELPAERNAKDSLRLVAPGAAARVFGLSFESGRPGVLYSVVGPVGADAKVYLDLERQSFTEQLKSARPDLVVLMVGGNDALKVRKQWRSLDEVRKDHEQLLELLRSALPEADLLMWTPMDAGEKKKGKVGSLPYITEVAELQRAVAEAKGVPLYDALASMGGIGSIERWAKAGIMNADLVHPKSKAAELLGLLFVRALLPALQR